MFAAIFYVLCLLHFDCPLCTFLGKSACGWGFKHCMYSACRLSTSLVEHPRFLAIISKRQIEPTENTATDKHPSDCFFFPHLHTKSSAVAKNAPPFIFNKPPTSVAAVFAAAGVQNENHRLLWWQKLTPKQLLGCFLAPQCAPCCGNQSRLPAI